MFKNNLYNANFNSNEKNLDTKNKLLVGKRENFNSRETKEAISFEQLLTSMATPDWFPTGSLQANQKEAQERFYKQSQKRTILFSDKFDTDAKSSVASRNQNAGAFQNFLNSFITPSFSNSNQTSQNSKGTSQLSYPKNSQDKKLAMSGNMQSEIFPSLFMSSNFNSKNENPKIDLVKKETFHKILETTMSEVEAELQENKIIQIEKFRNNNHYIERNSQTNISYDKLSQQETICMQKLPKCDTETDLHSAEIISINNSKRYRPTESSNLLNNCYELSVQNKSHYCNLQNTDNFHSNQEIASSFIETSLEKDKNLLDNNFDLFSTRQAFYSDQQTFNKALKIMFTTNSKTHPTNKIYQETSQNISEKCEKRIPCDQQKPNSSKEDCKTLQSTPSGVVSSNKSQENCFNISSEILENKANKLVSKQINYFELKKADDYKKRFSDDSCSQCNQNSVENLSVSQSSETPAKNLFNSSSDLFLTPNSSNINEQSFDDTLKMIFDCKDDEQNKDQSKGSSNKSVIEREQEYCAKSPDIESASRISPVLTSYPNAKNSLRNFRKKRTNEISTQTSNDIFHLSNTQCATLNMSNASLLDISCVLSKRNTQSFDTSHVQVSQEQTEPVRHILEELSDDITILPDGRKIFNNITKIGTHDWFKIALEKLKLIEFTTKQKKIDILASNYSSIKYANFFETLRLRRYSEGKTKICKIKCDKSRLLRSDSVELDCSLSWTKDIIKFFKQKPNKLGEKIDKLCTRKDLIRNDIIEHKIAKEKIQIEIHNIFAMLYDAFESGFIPNIATRAMHKKNCIFKDGRLMRTPFKQAILKRTSFKNKRSQSLFVGILYTLSKIYYLLQTNTKITKREFFYQIKHIVRTQSKSDRCINEVSCLLDVGPWHLNIICQTGLVYGNLKLFWSSGEITNCGTVASLIPNDLDDVVEVHSEAFFVLVVEKESIFRKLLEEDLPNKLERPFIMVTGKGVPSLNTRLFLNKITKLLTLPIFILVDADIYGIRIMLTYRFGAATFCHLSDEVTLPNARWLGVLPSEITKYGMKYEKLNKRDKQIIKSTMDYNYLKNYPKILEEISYLQEMDMKASIEDLMKSKTFLSDTYLPTKLFNEDFL